MIVLNGNKFAETGDEFASALFKRGGTCVGYIKPNKKSLTIYDSKMQKVGMINQYGLIVSASKVNGVWHYSYGMPRIVGEYENYTQQVTEAIAALDKLLPGVYRWESCL